MIIRELKESDLPRLKELHRRAGFDYQFPNTKEMLPMPVIVNENDEVVMAVGSLPVVEIFFFLDRDWETPGIKLAAFKELHEYVKKDLKSKGFIEGNAFLPPGLEKNFGRRLMQRFGWKKSKGWVCFSRRTD